METQTIQEKTKPNHGFNVMVRRKRLGLSQDDIADSLNSNFGTKYFQADISKLESHEEISDEMLDKLALVLNCSMNYLKDFDIDDLINSYNGINYGTMTSGDNASGFEQNLVKHQNIEKQEVINYPIDKITELYERIAKDAEERGILKQKVDDLTERLKKYKNR